MKILFNAPLYFARLGDRPEYVALSYKWSDDSDMKYISVDGMHLNARPSLWRLLQRSQPQDEWETTWIDAVCVNQKI